MSKLIYLVKQVNCRGDVWEDKFKADLEKTVAHLETIISSAEGRDDMYEVIEDVVNTIDDRSIEDTIWQVSEGLWFCATNEEEVLEELKKRVEMIRKGSGSWEGEECVVGLGLSPKEAILSMVDISEEEW